MGDTPDTRKQEQELIEMLRSMSDEVQTSEGGCGSILITDARAAADALEAAHAREDALREALRQITIGRTHADNAAGDNHAGHLMAGRMINIARAALKGGK